MTSGLVNAHTKELVGSIYQRQINYNLHDKVFDINHIQSPRAKQSKKDIIKYLHSINLDPLSISIQPWNNSTNGGKTINGKIVDSWISDNVSSDNRKYNTIERQYIIEQSKYRLECIRKGIEPYPDNNSINPVWNNSSHIQDEQRKSLHNYNDITLSHTLRFVTTDSNGEVLYLPKDRLTLVQQQTMYNLKQQQIKNELEYNKQKNNLQIINNKLLSHSKSMSLDSSNIVTIEDELNNAAEQIELEYNSDVLKQYIESQQHNDNDENNITIDNMFNDTISTRCSNKQNTKHRYSHSRIPSPKFISPRHTTLSASLKQSTIQQSINHINNNNAAVIARTTETTKLQPVKYIVPYTTRIHNGEYIYNNQLQCSIWSCCNNTAKDCIGCVLISDNTKQRIIETRTTLGNKLWDNIKHNAPNIKTNIQGTVVRYEHTGTYDINNATNEQFWSCCMASNQNSQGCKKVVVTKETAWNTQRPT